jgi:hypothetical protein
MKELEKLITALYISNQNLQRFSPPMKESPVLTISESGWDPEPVWTFCSCLESNAGSPARCPSRRHGHRSDKNGVYSTSHLFLTWFQSSIASSMRACSYQPHPSAIRVVQRELSSRGNLSSERTPRKTPTDCYLRAAAWQWIQEKNALPLCWAAPIATYTKRTDSKENTTSA